MMHLLSDKIKLATTYQSGELVYELFQKGKETTFDVYLGGERLAYCDVIEHSKTNCFEYFKYQEKALLFMKYKLSGRVKNTCAIEISLIKVVSENRTHGIGTRLLNFIAWYYKRKGVKISFLFAKNDFTIATYKLISFYEKAGYQIIEGTYSFMVKDL